MVHRKKAIAYFSIVGILLSASVAYAYTKKHANEKFFAAKEAQAKQFSESAKVIDSVSNTIQSVGVQNSSTRPGSAAPVVAAVISATQIANPYPLHNNISTTYFWAGEEAGKDNKNISNLPSAWDDNWAQHFGGVDDPKNRNGLVVANFVPKENSFYFALPYNDFDSNGNRKKDVGKVIPWSNSKTWSTGESMIKNQWIKITKAGKTAYAQWEDVGPFGEDDSAYVFGGAAPQSKTNEDAGLDVSPSVRDYLGLGDVDKTDWQFVSADQVPDGPWKKTLTSGQIFWN